MAAPVKIAWKLEMKWGPAWVGRPSVGDVYFEIRRNVRAFYVIACRPAPLAPALSLLDDLNPPDGEFKSLAEAKAAVEKLANQ